MNALTFAEVFGGTGQLALGLCLADIEHAWICELDDWRREEILAQRFPDAVLYKDIRDLRADELPPVDGIAGGFPCKGGSTAGKRNGFEHPETVLWEEQFRLIRELRPRYVLVENVANLLALRPPGLWKGWVWGKVLGDLASLGFHIWWDCIPAAAVGAPHRRDRVFAVAADPTRIGRQGSRAGRETLVGTQTDDRGSSPHSDDERREERHGTAEPVRPALPGTTDDRHELVADPGSSGRSEGSGLREGQQGSVGRRRPVDRCGETLTDPERECRERRGEPGNLAAEGRGVEGEARERQRGRDAAVDHGATPPDTDPGKPPAIHSPEPPVGPRHAGRPSPQVERIGVEWGKYTGAIQRWEAIFGPAPEPLIRRMDDGGARRVDRSRLSALGDGVQVQVGFFVGQFIQRLERGEVKS